MFLKNIASVHSTIETIGQFGDFSGLRLNIKKTKAICLGPWRFNRKKPLELNWTSEPEKALGIFISYDDKKNYQKNVAAKIDKLNTKLDIWRGRKLYLFGKCLIAKNMGLSQLVYSASVLDVNLDDIFKNQELRLWFYLEQKAGQN